MRFAGFFINRPIFAAVLSIIIFVSGLIALPLLPISEYPEVVPPTVEVRTMYRGANASTISETVAAPLEEAINGVEDMIYMKSVASSDGVLTLIVTFKPGTDPDTAQVQVQNRVSQALPRLPEEVRQVGVITQKSAPDLSLVVHLISPDGRYDATYLRNYAVLHVKDEISRIKGVGNAPIFGAGDYAMRIWLDPAKVASRGLTGADVVRAIREQNIQVSAGQVGAPPQPNISDFTVSINAQGRLTSTEEFGAIILKAGQDGEVTKLSDVARLELGASEYSLRALLDGKQAVAIPIFQSPGANLLDLSRDVKAKMTELAARFPDGVTWDVVYDPSVFVEESVSSVVTTLLEAIALVVLVVILFLQTWRASIIPLLAVPVSIVGSLAVLFLMGFSINTLTLFGLVLATGIVVDDAIVVVENVERAIANGLKPKAAALQAMKEVSGPIIAIAAVLVAVFVPMAFLEGVTGQFYRQFAFTIAVSTVISAINSLTLSPALAAVLLRSHGEAPDAPSRWLEKTFGWLFRPFNRFFQASSDRYSVGVTRSIAKSKATFAVYGALLALTWIAFQAVPGGFIPAQDKLYVIGGVKMPEGSSLDRTEAAIKKMTELGLATEGVDYAVAFPGLNVLQFTNTPNMGTVFFPLKGFDERDRPATEIAAELMGKFQGMQEGFAFAIMPPPILGLGTGSGYSAYIQDRAGLGYGELQTAAMTLSGAVSQVPGMHFPITSYQANVPQLAAEVDREKAKIQNVAINDVFETLQVYLGGVYINDFNLFGRTFRVIAQGEATARDQVEDIAQLRTRNLQGEMVPIGSVLKTRDTYGPDPVVRFNGYPSADIIGEADPRLLSSTESMGALSAVASKVLPAGMSLEWTDLSFQQATQGNAAMIVFPLSALLVFLVLAALYESWTLPLAVILIVPMAMLAALAGVWLVGGDNNVFVQVGLVVLMGLASKNAILIVEFARELEHQGRSIVAAAIEASRLRLRPIVMTSVAFIAGVTPLVFSSGAGAEVRQATGVTVFAGMIGVTVFGLFLTPVFYVALRKLAERIKRPSETRTQAELPLENTHA